MKHKLSLILAGLVISGTMAGCGASADSSQASYISKDSARAAALAAAGIDASSANITSTQFSERDGIPYYEVDFTANGMSYSYSIDAVTGVIIESEDSKQQDSTVTDYDTLEVSTTPANTPVITDYDTANGSTGTAPNAASAPAPAAGTAKEVTLDTAKQTALQHAGKSASEVNFVKAHKDVDDGRSIYEIEFVVQSGNSYQEYDYEIDASTGAIISSDFDAESYAPPKQQSTTKTEAEVRSIALAKVPGAKASDCSLWLDSDDGHLIYEGKIIYNQMEYEFDIDAYSGTILEWDAESIYD
ncbi:MAG: PepSY domain-containing protein [Butyricicoccus pullicaecorum]|nr:PepSY domain-containing protein [Butyricicoccus pullicaecorum]